MIEAFAFARTPRIHFGAGVRRDLAALLRAFGDSVLVVTGAHALDASGHWDELQTSLGEVGLDVRRAVVEGEPSPDWVDELTAQHHRRLPAVVVAVGGGSVLDAGKALSAMLCEEDRVVDFLEGVGTGASLSGKTVPFVAVPTTAGTGSEATKNAVLSRIGAQGFKKSLRHEALVPDLAVIDPELAVTCPPAVTAACGMDAFTQLLEAFVSTKASPMTDGLLREALRRAGRSLVPAATTEGHDVSRRADLAYAALVSGIALANAGLGIVHGLASPIGARFDIPHGVVCGTLVAAAARANVEMLRATDPEGEGLRRHAEAGRFIGAPPASDRDGAIAFLLETLDGWTRTLAIPRLGVYGVEANDVPDLVAGAGLKNNPAPLSEAEIADIVTSRLRV